MVVSCKSWQKGFNPASRIKNLEQDKIISGRESWRSFRDLTNRKWSEAFLESVQEVTGQTRFTYVTAVTKVNGDRALWENYEPFKAHLNNNPIKLMSFDGMLNEVYSEIGSTPASSQVGRVLQLIKASGWQSKL